MSKSIRVPAETGRKGLPPGVGSSKAPKRGFVVPSEIGSRGKPHKRGFPNTPPARD